MTFKFPVWHDSCNSCDSRFECWTDRVVIVFGIDEDVYGKVPFEFKRPFYFGLSCFELNENWWNRHKKMSLIPHEFGNKKIMSLIIHF